MGYYLRHFHYSDLPLAPLYWDSVLTAYCPEHPLEGQFSSLSPAAWEEASDEGHAGLFGPGLQCGGLVLWAQRRNSQTDSIQAQTYPCPGFEVIGVVLYLRQ